MGQDEASSTKSEHVTLALAYSVKLFAKAPGKNKYLLNPVLKVTLVLRTDSRDSSS